MRCDFCDKKGLAVLPVRPAVVRCEVGAPALAAEIKPAVPARAKVTYTCRLLREGYLYVWDEKRRRWTDYLVTGEGYFRRTDAALPVVDAPSCIRPCAGKKDEVAKASFITLPVSLNAENHGRFWFAWSDYPWTPVVRQAHEQAGWRERHMQCFDLAAWLKERRGPQALPLSQLQETVAEYVPALAQGGGFDFLSAPWLARDDDAARYLLETAVSVSSQPPLRVDPTLPVMLALCDATAVARDLAQILAQAPDESLEYCRNSGGFSDFDREMKLHAMIETMRYSVQESEKMFITQEMKRREERASAGYVTGAFGEMQYVPMTAQTRRVVAEMIHDAAKKQFENWSSESWPRYQEYYRVAEQRRFETKVRQAMDVFYATHTGPLTEMYLEQLRHPTFIRFFEHNFDPTDIAGGAHYSLTLGLCLLGGQQEGRCFEFYRERLQGDPEDPENPFLRAWLLNQDSLAQMIKRSAPTQVAMSHVHELPWSAMIGAYASWLGELGSRKELLNTLSIPLTGVLLSLLGEMGEKGVSRFIVLLSVRTEAPLAYFERQGRRRELSEKLSRLLLNHLFDGEGLSPAKRVQARERFVRQVTSRPDTQEMVKLLEKEMLQKEASGINLQGEARQGYLMLLQDEMDDALKGRSVDERLAWAKERAMSGDMAEDFLLKRRLTRASLGGNVVSVLFQLAAVGLMVKQEQSWYGGVKTPAAQRLTATWAGIAGSTLETAAGMIQFHMMRGMRAARPWVKVLGRLGKGLGLAASGFIAWLDILEGWKQWTLGHQMLASFYWTSAGLGFIGLIFIFMGLPMLGIVLGIMILGVAYLIEYFKPNDMQNWLSRTYWGVADPDNKEQPFITGQQEEDGFNQLWQPPASIKR
ncbi:MULTISPECIES: T6SS effector BTH_I2691 family protein [Tenebrionibacter/Tenebrionicola group]|jgi:hypothetical protein|uniref:Toxin VasX N-terminal region domain-containing protein n=2 Tax=Tenebrionibacter/Tenebrionicola group TaxID=2969848 RepID=A0A8K0V5P1_9ENTR|nr:MULTISPECIES: T6SS effector BTH_I2691 family protein [Tenebrionibacter/Tenebrionicola group]MBK4714657.1 hypothetical protein [Tenebrionibacter intestinalis]MBV5095127.1 hypothetical protein [Tenebrionicola larvae]